MISTRGLLVRQLQEFFETRMLGVYRWGFDVKVRKAEKAEKVPGERQGDQPIAIVDFDGYSLMLHSPEDKPPLGRILLFHERHGIFSGPIDAVTWDRIEAAIKDTRGKDERNVA